MNRPSCFGGYASQGITCTTCPYEEGCLERHNRMSELGRKDDTTKPRWSLLPYGTIVQVIGVLEFGAKKYEVGNWKHVPDARTRYYDATMRHLEWWWLGQENDPESGLPHLAHAVCCLLFLMWFDVQVAARDEILKDLNGLTIDIQNDLVLQALNKSDLPKDTIGAIMERLKNA